MRVVVILVLGLLGACGFQLTPAGGAIDAPGGDNAPPTDIGIDQPAAGTWLAGFDYRKKITFTSGTATTLDDFVAGVLIGTDTDLAARARDDGRDFVFTAADEVTIIDFEIERFDGSTGGLTAWVRINSLTPTTEIYLYYGGSTADAQDVANTWPAIRYGAVWHLTDPTIATARDSTPNAVDLTAPAVTNTPMLELTGIAGSARRYDGTNDILQRDGAMAPSLQHGTDAFSYGGWVFATSNQTSYDMVFYKGGASSGDVGYDLELGTGAWTTYVCCTAGSTQFGVFGQEAQLVNRWVQLLVVVDRATQKLRMYVDGAQANEVLIPALGSISSTRGVAIGNTTYPFAGVIDEMRVYKTALTPQWVGAEYRNLALATRDAFRAVSAQEATP